VTISTRVNRHAGVLAVAERFPDAYCSIGTHPHHAHEELDVTAADLVARTRHAKVVALGEAGLDYHYDNSPRAAQERGFRTHIAAARDTGLPLVIHSREADDDTARILEEETAKGAFSAVLHCFTGGYDRGQAFIAQFGLYLGIGGAVTFKNAAALHDAAARLPLDRLVLETDCPYMTPAPHRGRRNEPSFLTLVCARLAELRGQSPDAVAQATSANALRLFDGPALAR